MKNRLSRRQKIAVATLMVAVPIAGGVGSAYLTAYGEGSSTAEVAEQPPYVSGGTTAVALVPNEAAAATVDITNTLNKAIVVTQIPQGLSRQYTVADDTFLCPAGSVKIAAVGDGVNALTQTDESTTVIQPGGTGTYAVQATFDVDGLVDDGTGANLQDACLGKTLDVNFGRVAVGDAP